MHAKEVQDAIAFKEKMNSRYDGVVEGTKEAAQKVKERTGSFMKGLFSALAIVPLAIMAFPAAQKALKYVLRPFLAPIFRPFEVFFDWLNKTATFGHIRKFIKETAGKAVGLDNMDAHVKGMQEYFRKKVEWIGDSLKSIFQ